MQRKWLYLHDGKTHGPFTVEEIKTRAAQGKLDPTDKLWSEGSDPAKAAPAARAIAFPKISEAGPKGEPPAAAKPAVLPAQPAPPTPAAVAAVHEADIPVQERYRRACAALSQWADRDENAALVMAGNTEAICSEPTVLDILCAFQHEPFEILEKLMEHLDSMVENRANYYRAMAQRK